MDNVWYFLYFIVKYRIVYHYNVSFVNSNPGASFTLHVGDTLLMSIYTQMCS